MKKFNKKDYLIFVGCFGLVVAAMWYNSYFQSQNQVYFPRALSADDLAKYSNNDTRAVVIYSVFTQYAYNVGGFYDYYSHKCDVSCLTLVVNPENITASYVTGNDSLVYLKHLNYSVITDIDVDKNPDILKNYDKIILLHDEYMTKREFNAIENHKNVIYLYPNSAYAEVSYDQNSHVMRLLYGHGYDGDDDRIYQQTNVTNGFGFVTTSNNEYNLNCRNYYWEQMPNGMQISCFPEFLVKSDRSLLQTIKDYPGITPKLVVSTNVVNPSNLPNCNAWGYCPDNMPAPK